MQTRFWLPAIVTAVMVTMGTGCGDECVDQFDCRSDKGQPADGKQWTCNSGTCEQRDIAQGSDAGTEGDAGTEPDAGEGDAGTDPDAGTEGCTSNATCALTETCNTTTSTCEDSGFVTPVATTSTQIQAVRDAADGALDPALPIEGAFVTFIKPAVTGSSELPGFFVQAEAQGPALFVSDATALAAVVVGDRVSFSVSSKATTDGLRSAVTVTGTTVISQGHPVQSQSTATPAGLAVNRSADTTATLVDGLDAVDSELTYLTGTIATDSSGIGAGYSGFQITTEGVTAGAANFRLRVPATLATELDITQGCTFTLNAGPIWRFAANAQPSAFTASDLTLSNCAAPTFASASATSLTEVVLNFSRNISTASITNAQEQFTLTEGLTVSAFRVEGKQVFLTTSEQAPGASYSVTVANTVTDLAGGSVASEASTQTFRGFRTAAVLRISEVQPNMASAEDLVELEVITGGTTAGLILQQDVNSDLELAQLPDVTVATGDIIVVHLNPDDTVENPFRSETQSKDEIPQSAEPTRYDTAWDFRGTDDHAITFSSRILLVKDAAGTIQDAVPFARTTGTPPAAFIGNIQAIQAAGHWLPADCGGAPCTTTSNPTAAAVAADWTGIPASAGSVTRASNSVRRISATDTNTKDDWAVGAPSWGLPNL
ncbi:Ig-like domain-containing protein [Myxococcus sp. SDU36]|uniref:Ig-like domain-containing protein n=1 Tax=Myxococcus sp. SDU36 TaxID=2831967 RepID=UPI0025438ECC|nr:Ig-like domain-containing protein [Myxococcus sp. SDU36]WIG93832.1 Ig-like domain-containing protein [Myxococcus sp. SDU36]